MGAVEAAVETQSQAHSVAPPGPTAGVTGRLAALAVDALLLTTLLFAVSIALSAVVGPPVRIEHAAGASPHRLIPDPRRVTLAALVNGLIGAAYFVGFWAVGSGQEPRGTPGQLLVGLRVGQADDERRLRIGQALGRWTLLMGPLAARALVAPALPMLRAPLAIASLAWYVVLLVSTVRSDTGRGFLDRLTGSAVIRRTRPAAPMAAPAP